METLHKYSYDMSTAVSALVPSSGPILCRDEMEEWSASEVSNIITHITHLYTRAKMSYSFTGKSI